MKNRKTKLVTLGVLAAVLGLGVTVGSLGVAAAVSTATRGYSARSTSLEFSGKVTAYNPATVATPGSLTLTDEAGTTLNFATSTTTTITQIDGSGSALAINDFATVDSSLASPSDATAISFSAAAPVSLSGIVTTYSPATSTTVGSITIMRRDHTATTYAVRSTTKITENGGAGDAIRVDDFATIQAAASAPVVALAITFDPNELVRTYGRVITYSPATSTTAGSVTVVDRGGSDVTFATSTVTNIMAIGGSGGNLTVGDYAIVRAAATSKSDALSISFSTHPESRRHLAVVAHR